MNIYIDGVLTPPADAGSLDGIPAALQPVGPGEDGHVVTYVHASGDLELKPGGGGGMVNPMNAVGNLIVGGPVVGGLATPTRLAIGPAGYILRSVAGAPAWREISAAGTAAARPTPAAAVREGQTYWSTDAAAGAQLSICLHKGGATYAWETLAYGVTATGAALVQAADAAAARAAIGGASAGTLANAWSRPSPTSVSAGTPFVNVADLTEQVSSGLAVSPGVAASGWMQRLPTGLGAGRAGFGQVSASFGARAYADSIDLDAYAVGFATMAVLWTWDGTQPQHPAAYAEIAMIGDRDNVLRGIHLVYLKNGVNTDLGIYCNGAATVLVASINLRGGAVGLHALAVAPILDGVDKWCFSYDGDAVVDVAMTAAYAPPSSTDAISLGARADGVVFNYGLAIELALWGSKLLSPDILALATLPATPTYELPESASTGAAPIRIQACRYDPQTSLTAMPARGLPKLLTVDSATTTKVTL